MLLVFVILPLRATAWVLRIVRESKPGLLVVVQRSDPSVLSEIWAFTIIPHPQSMIVHLVVFLLTQDVILLRMNSYSNNYFPDSTINSREKANTTRKFLSFYAKFPILQKNSLEISMKLTEIFSIHNLMQSGLVFFTIGGLILISLKLPAYGLIMNLISQIFWLHASYSAWKNAGQIGIFINTIIFSIITAFGVVNYWFL